MFKVRREAYLYARLGIAEGSNIHCHLCENIRTNYMSFHTPENVKKSLKKGEKNLKD
jgi:hypothetical protein